MESLRRLLWGILLLLAANLLSLWVGEYRRTLDQALLEVDLGARERQCRREIYRLRAEDLYDIDERIDTLEWIHRMKD